MTENRRRRTKPKPGDVFAVPLQDGSYGLGHVVDVDQWEGPFALFGHRAGSPKALLEGLDQALERPLTILVLTANWLKNGQWPIIANRRRDYSAYGIPTDGKGWSHTFGVAMEFLNAYHGLDPWDGLADPKAHERVLIRGVPVPATVRYKRDFATVAPPEPERREPVTDGPAMVTIQLVYPGTGMPSVEMLRKRQAVERRVEAAGAGEVEGAESGAGVMEIFLRTGEVRRAVPLVEKIAAEMGFANDMLIETAPIEDEEP